MTNFLKSFAILFCIIGIAVSASVQNVPSSPPAPIVGDVSTTAAATPEVPTTTFPSTTVTQAATKKFDVPTTIKTPTTTSSPATTTTKIEITTTTPDLTTFSTTPETAVTDDE
uniref:Uncharacterized protein n=1 Tax=Panagrolaimus sp. ES5 TaxID=591445 RepID=A0AC34GFG2_9BILA